MKPILVTSQAEWLKLQNFGLGFFFTRRSWEAISEALEDGKPIVIYQSESKWGFAKNCEEPTQTVDEYLALQEPKSEIGFYCETTFVKCQSMFLLARVYNIPTIGFCTSTYRVLYFVNGSLFASETAEATSEVECVTYDEFVARIFHKQESEPDYKALYEAGAKKRKELETKLASCEAELEALTIGNRSHETRPNI